jgi:hypothetical protein
MMNNDIKNTAEARNQNIESPLGNSHISVNADEDLAALNKVEGVSTESSEKDVEATFEKILAASRRSAQ